MQLLSPLNKQDINCYYVICDICDGGIEQSSHSVIHDMQSQWILLSPRFLYRIVVSYNLWRYHDFYVNPFQRLLSLVFLMVSVTVAPLTFLNWSAYNLWDRPQFLEPCTFPGSVNRSRQPGLFRSCIQKSIIRLWIMVFLICLLSTSLIFSRSKALGRLVNDMQSIILQHYRSNPAVFFIYYVWSIVLLKSSSWCW